MRVNCLPNLRPVARAHLPQERGYVHYPRALDDGRDLADLALTVGLEPEYDATSRSRGCGGSS